MKFIGREPELKHLNRLYRQKESQLVVIYGRRRVGKSTLVEQFVEGKKHLRFEGLEGSKTPGQINQVLADLNRQVNDPLLQQIKIDSWLPIFDYLTKLFSSSNERYVLFLDELQWLAANQKKLVSIIKKYWDNHWSKQNVMLILCGSVSSYMIKRVISSNALYGRINWELCLQPLNPLESFELLDGKRNLDEILQYTLIVGGIPKYLREVNPNKSFDQNINNMFFTKNGIFVNDYTRIFYGQFREHKIYEKIVRFIKDSPKTLKEISEKLNIPSSGGVKSYLDNLEKALFVTSFIPYDKINSKLKKYKLTDEYLRFYFKYVEPHLKLISTNHKRDLFNQLVKPVWNGWLGLAFENYCLKNALFLSELMGFDDRVENFGPYFHRQDEKFQIDLLYLRTDKVITLCEIKYSQQPVPVSVINEVERKCKLISVPHGYTLEKALISRFGPEKSLQELGYFHHTIQVGDFFS